MMNADDISRKVLDAADAVSKKTAGLIEEGKLLIKIREIERNIEKGYRKIGQILYENNRNLLDGETEEIADQLDALMIRLNDLRRDHAQVRDMKLCENCGAANKNDSVFCSQCGERFY
jgi:hypothetical protein